MVDTMGDLLTARRHFDRGMAIRSSLGPADALPEFVAATDADPSMADAWLGRIACGDHDLTSLRQLHTNSEWLHRETTRIGRTLSADIQLGPYVGITVTDASQVGLALSSALTIAGEYAEADALLANRELLDSWRNHQWHQLARAFLMFVTQRWPDVLLTAAEDLPPQAIVMSAVTASICALAAHAAAHLGQGHVALDWLDRVDVIGHNKSSARFDSHVLTASIGPADIPLLVADLAYVRGMVYRQLHEDEKARIWLSKATINGVLTEPAKEALADPKLRLVVTDEQTIASRTDKWDPATAKSRDQLDDDDAVERRAELLAEGRELLARQVGLAAVKQAVAALEDQLEVRTMRLEHGLPVEGQTNHMLLVGPPGTGKTTTAEALGKIYAGMGIVRHPEIREVRRSDFCGHYIGESGPKTNELIEKSLGRIIFMDEFYSLVERHQDGTPDMIGMEAVNQLLVALEAHRFDFCFIGAGYEDQVDEFLSVNPGLAGRFNRKLRFESYSPAEIVEIGQRYATPRASLLDDAARQTFLDAATTIRDYTTPAGQHGIDAMQNGRFARNVIERAEGFRDTRVVAQKRAGQPVSVQDLQIITAADIQAAVRSVCSDNRDMAAIVW
ncbi:type VII secretion AAA-ATPase EccA [Mycobacterium gastri]|nr:type VII secretion AAA-ATPase EccA [Mycobacterium gastri]